MSKERDKKPTLVVITGPTGSGKTDLSLKVAKHFGSPIVSSDSRQLYRGLKIGTAQPTEEQLKEVEHHFIASHDITEDYTAGRYEKEALKLLEELFEAHSVVVLVGGSGLYVNALCQGLDKLPKSDPSLRKELNQRLEQQGIENLLSELAELDPLHYEQIDKQNPNRVIRALEVCLLSGKPYSKLRKGEDAERNFNIIKLATDLPRPTIYERINRRVDKMVEAGLEEEARHFYPHRELNSLQTVGYREWFSYFDGEISREEAIELLKRNTRRYAKRQLTWLRRDEDIIWVEPTNPLTVIEIIEQNIERQAKQQP